MILYENETIDQEYIVKSVSCPPYDDGNKNQLHVHLKMMVVVEMHARAPDFSTLAS
jgi:hypothetical protein